jgi:hypothetical protein
VRCCLQIVSQLLKTEFSQQLQSHFIRHGIRETITEFTRAEVIEQMNQLDSQHSNLREISHKELY